MSIIKLREGAFDDAHDYCVSNLGNGSQIHSNLIVSDSTPHWEFYRTHHFAHWELTIYDPDCAMVAALRFS